MYIKHKKNKSGTQNLEIGKIKIRDYTLDDANRNRLFQENFFALCSFKYIRKHRQSI